MNEDEKLTFLDTIEELKAKLIELGVAKADLQSNTVEGSGETYGMGGAGDILGMTPENWLKFFENIQDGIYGLEELAATVGLLQRDRKSTRLNSSHVAISYAVFCLKKKKK